MKHGALDCIEKPFKDDVLINPMLQWAVDLTCVNRRVPTTCLVWTAGVDRPPWATPTGRREPAGPIMVDGAVMAEHLMPNESEDDGGKLLRTEGLTKTYIMGLTEVIALDNVDFVARTGEFIAIPGPGDNVLDGRSVTPWR